MCQLPAARLEPSGRPDHSPAMQEMQGHQVLRQGLSEGALGEVHQKHCKYFADHVKARQWDHREENCSICRQSSVVVKSQLRRPDNPNYECIFEEVKKVPPQLYHPHPFPVTGDPGDTSEKTSIILWQLMKKFQLTQPAVVSNCLEEIVDVFSKLKINRLFIWKIQKISPQSQMQRFEALATQVIPFQDVLSIICGGSREQTCTFCSKKIIITNVNSIGPEGPGVELTCLATGIYSCEGYNCLEKLGTMREDYARFDTAVMTAVRERWSSRCDFCLKLPPRSAVHRCSKCLAVMYCGTHCRDQDKEIHREFCKEDLEERKKKLGGSARRKEAREVLEKVEKELKERNIQEACEIVGKFKLKNSTKK